MQFYFPIRQAMETLPTALLAHAERTPDKVFIEVWDETRGVELQVTFSQLADCMLSGAQWLRAATGLQRGEYCAMLAHNSVAYLSVSLGAMALGAISLNLNWRQPDSTTRTLLEDLSPKVLVASKPFKGLATTLHRTLGIKMVLLESICSTSGLPLQPPPDADAEQLRREIRSNAAGSPSEVGANMTAAVFFTGGTTGTPKAVPHTHRSMLWLAEKQLSLFPQPFGEDVPNSGTVCFTPFFHVRPLPRQSLAPRSNLCPPPSPATTRPGLAGDGLLRQFRVQSARGRACLSPLQPRGSPLALSHPPGHRVPPPLVHQHCALDRGRAGRANPLRGAVRGASLPYAIQSDPTRSKPAPPRPKPKLNQ